MTFNLENAIDYIKSKIADFYSTGNRLNEQKEEASRLVLALQQIAEDPTDAERILTQIINKLRRWQSLEIMIRPFADFWGVNKQGLGVIPLLPIALLTTAISVAINLYQFFAEPSDFRAALDLIARDKLTPQQAQELGVSTGLFGGLNQALILAILGLGGFLLLTARR